MDLEEVYDAYREDPAFEHFRTPSIRLVPGFGSYRPKVLLVGEAPGATENTRGRPFCGPSGRILEGLMEAAGLRFGPGYPEGGHPADRLDAVDPPNAFVTNVVKYRPPGNRTPTEAEIEASRPYLRDEWSALGRPRCIIAVGSVAKAALLLRENASLTQLAGVPIAAGSGTWIVPEFHPAYGLRRASVRSLMEIHWKKLGEFLIEEGIIGDD